jgi:hypothetical protein
MREILIEYVVQVRGLDSGLKVYVPTERRGVTSAIAPNAGSRTLIHVCREEV